MQLEKVSDIHFGLSERMRSEEAFRFPSANTIVGDFCVLAGLAGFLNATESGNFIPSNLALYLSVIAYGIFMQSFNKSKAPVRKVEPETNNSFQTEIVEVNS